MAKAYVAALRDLLRSLEVSDVRMDQGSLRCDANLSLTPAGNPVFGTRTETKNVNSLRSVERAVRYEISRQAAILAAGGTDHPGDPALRGVDRHHPAGPVEGDRGGLPVLPGARSGAAGAGSRNGSNRSGRRCPRCPWLRRDRLQTDWGFTDLEMRDLVAADAVELVAATVAAGASPGDARSGGRHTSASRPTPAGSRSTTCRSRRPARRR